MKTFNYEEFPKKLERLINERHLKVKDVAYQLGVTPQAVYKWIKGEAYPDYEKLAGLTGVLDVPLQELFLITDLDWTPTR